MIYSFGSYKLDTGRLELWCGPNPVAVEPQVFSLLLYLIENSDRVVSKDDLIAAVWRGRIVSDATLSSRINAARRAVGDDGKEQTVIRTIPRRGFRFIAEYSEASERTGAPTGSTDSNESANLPPPEKPSVAVLPFDNLSGDPDQEYFVDGVTEDVIITLSKIPQLLVIARNSTFAYKGKSPDIRQVGRELGVRYVLEGSARHAGGRVRVAAQLIDAATGHHLWAERYDRDLGDDFAVQDEIAGEVVTALEVKLTRGEQARLWRKRAGTVEAYEYFQRGRDLYMSFNRETNAQAIQLLARALEVSPEFTDAMAYLGWAEVALAQYGWTGSPAKSYRRAEELGRRILAIDGSYGSGHALLAYVHLLNGRHAAAVTEAEKAVALEPNGADMYHVLAMTYGYTGRYDDAVRCERQALRLSPLAPENAIAELARAYCHLGRAGEAISVLQYGLERRPSWMTFRTLLVFAYAEAGMAADARAEAAKILKMKPDFSVSSWARIHPYEDAATLKHFMNALRAAGLPE